MNYIIIEPDDYGIKSGANKLTIRLLDTLKY